MSWPRRRPEPAGRGAADDGGFEQCAPEGAHLSSDSEDERGSAEGASGQRGRRTGRSALPASWGKDKAEPEPLTAAQLRIKGITLLARREHSRAELKKKLGRHSDDKALIDEALDQLQAEKLLSDARFAEGVARVRGARFGSARVAQDLRARGVSGELAAGLVKDLKASDAERAQEAWQKRFGEAAEDAAGRAKQMRFLHSRGFAPEVIRRVVPRAKVALRDETDE